jgi:hypothetical protein
LTHFLAHGSSSRFPYENIEIPAACDHAGRTPGPIHPDKTKTNTARACSVFRPCAHYSIVVGRLSSPGVFSPCLTHAWMREPFDHNPRILIGRKERTRFAENPAGFSGRRPDWPVLIFFRAGRPALCENPHAPAKPVHAMEFPLFSCFFSAEYAFMGARPR